jgi:UDP-glucose 4-epimerase
MRVLVTGGAGYIGSHIVKELLSKDYQVTILDNLQSGHLEAITGGDFIQGDLADSELLDNLFEKHKIDAVIHLAANSLVGESMVQPGKYFRNNICHGLNLLDTMVKYGVNKLVFSSTAAVYGEPDNTPITESFSVRPTNNYGKSKLMFEEILNSYNQAHGLKAIALRYFNAAGADPGGLIGEAHNPETHLIPLALQVAKGVREKLFIYGTDYPTSDGTCIRDYIHVNDLASAHLLSLEALFNGADSGVYNLGNGSGYSVKQVIETIKKISGLPIRVEEMDRRPGDPAVLVASSEKIQGELGWQPRYSDLDFIIETAWKWHQEKGSYVCQ